MGFLNLLLTRSGEGLQITPHRFMYSLLKKTPEITIHLSSVHTSQHNNPLALSPLEHNINLDRYLLYAIVIPPRC